MTSSSNRTLERIARRIPVPEPAYERLLRRRDRKRRNQRITAGVVGVAVFLVAIWIVTGGLPFQHTGKPAASPTIQPTPASAVGAIPETDYLLDLNTGKMTPLPESIAGTGNRTGDYVASPDGSKLAYAGPGDNGEPQIFVANLDGTGVEQVTAEVRGAEMPAWSPDGSKIAYIGHRGDEPGNVFVLDLATGASTQITFETEWAPDTPSFSPDESSIVYSISPHNDGEVRSIPIAGGESVRLVGGSGAEAGDGQLSPDGSLLSYGCPITNRYGDIGVIWDRCLANADGTDARVLFRAYDGLWTARWSPEGTRIATWEFHTSFVFVVDVATGGVTQVTKGANPVWLDDHTLIVQPTCRALQSTGCPG